MYTIYYHYCLVFAYCQTIEYYFPNEMFFQNLCLVSENFKTVVFVGHVQSCETVEIVMKLLLFLI